MKTKLKQYLPFILSFIVLFTLLPGRVQADMGPKPSVEINLTGLGEQTAVVTLLSKNKQNGPWSADHVNGTSEGVNDLGLKNFTDPDGWYYLNNHEVITGSGSFAWTYYPPEPFKVLIWFPESNGYAESVVTKRYAFHSTYHIDLAQVEPSVGEIAPLQLQSGSRWGWLPSSMLLIRLALTLLIEILIALAFAYRKKKQLMPIVLVNIATQLGLTLFLSVIEWQAGLLASSFLLIVGEFAVFLIEAFLFAKIMSRPTMPEPRKASRAVTYALVANTASLLIGLLLDPFWSDFLRSLVH